MKHADCGGNIIEIYDGRYDYTDEEGVFHQCPTLRCDKCTEEILGDGDIELENDDRPTEEI